MTRALLPLLALLAAAASLLPDRAAVPAAPRPWPATWEGRPLAPLPLIPADRALTADFPGRVARFSDGRGQVVLRRVAAPTRRLHPARACFRALGYELTPAPAGAGARGGSCFMATRDGEVLRVCEEVRDADGRRFADVSGWYWAALLRRSRGPWLAAMTAERVR